MREHLLSDGNRHVVILQGLGGIGKTQLAIANTKQYRDDYSAVLWLNAKDETSVKSSFAQMARQIRREHPAALPSTTENGTLDEAVDAVKSWLGVPSNNRWLLVCDNYDNPRVPGNTDEAVLSLQTYLPETNQGSIIITTRSSLVKLGHYMHVTKFDTIQAGVEVLKHSSRRSNLEDDDGAAELARKLDGLPLALATAGAYLSQSAITCSKYLELYTQSWARLQGMTEGLTTYDRTLSSTWQVSYDQIERKNSTAAKLLRFWAYLDYQDLWFELLNHADDQSPEWLQHLVQDELTFEACVRVLCSHGLVDAKLEDEFGVESPGYSVHPCVHSWMLAVLNAQVDDSFPKAAIQCVTAHLPSLEAPDAPLLQRRLLTHANRCSGYLETFDPSDLQRASVCMNLAIMFQAQTKLTQAVEMYSQALQLREFMLGPRDKRTLFTVYCIGTAYAEQRQIMQAEQMASRACQGCNEVFGPEHSLTLDSLNLLGTVFYFRGNFEAAGEMLTRASLALKRKWGPLHVSTLGVMNNLGRVYVAQGKLQEAEQIYMQVIEGKKTVLGPERVEILTTRNNLGVLYLKQARFTEAEVVLKQVWAGRRRLLGRDHASTLDALCALSTSVWRQGKMIEAVELLVRAVSEQGKSLSACTSMSRIFLELGHILELADELGEAEDVYKFALNGYRKIYGAKHPQTLSVVTRIGHIYIKQGRLEKAEILYRRANHGLGEMASDLRKGIDILGRCITMKKAIMQLKLSADMTKELLKRHTSDASNPATDTAGPQIESASLKRGLKRRWSSFQRG